MFRFGITFVVVALSASCAQLPQRGPAAAPVDDVQACRAGLGGPVMGNASFARDALDAEAIRLVNWNVRKGGEAEVVPWLEGSDLALFQEAVEDDSFESRGHYASFAPGFATAERQTGVMTVSTVAPLTRCQLRVREPWLGTPKAIGVTEFALTDSANRPAEGFSADTLVVVNVHAINFALGLADFEAQLDLIFRVLVDHTGPVIVSGDFNTWRAGRTQLLADVTTCHGFSAVDFRLDHRVTVFGQTLDQIFVRGLTVVDATTAVTPSSDHNVMIVTLRT